MKKTLFLLAIAAASFVIVKCGNAENSNENKSGTAYLTDSAIYNLHLLKGADYAKQTGAVLIKNVTDAITEKGAEYAIGFCNTKALPLTDSMGKVQNISIKRVTDKPRNPSNLANTEELQYIRLLKNAAAAGEKPGPQLQEIDGKIVGYYPIITNDMCMQCHGEKSLMAAELSAKLNKLYPADLATGYKPNELRGLWVIEMMKE